MDIMLTESDLAMKMEVLTLILDTYKTINNIIEFIPEKAKDLYLHE